MRLVALSGWVLWWFPLGSVSALLTTSTYTTEKVATSWSVYETQVPATSTVAVNTSLEVALARSIFLLAAKQIAAQAKSSQNLLQEVAQAVRLDQLRSELSSVSHAGGPTTFNVSVVTSTPIWATRKITSATVISGPDSTPPVPEVPSTSGSDSSTLSQSDSTELPSIPTTDVAGAVLTMYSTQSYISNAAARGWMTAPVFEFGIALALLLWV